MDDSIGRTQRDAVWAHSLTDSASDPASNAAVCTKEMAANLNIMRACGLCLVSGATLALAFPKVSLGFLAWGAFVPLYFAIDGKRLRRVFWLTWLQQIAFLICTLYWFWIPLHVDGNTPIAITVGVIVFVSSAEALFGAASVLSAEFVSRRLRVSRLISYPIAWTALEWVRSFFPVGFPWNPLGDAVFREIPVIQIAEFIGVFGLSALIIFVNVALWELISSAIAGRRNSRTAAALALVTAVVIGFGMLRIRELERMPAAGHLKVAMIRETSLRVTNGIRRSSLRPSKFTRRGRQRLLQAIRISSFGPRQQPASYLSP